MGGSRHVIVTISSGMSTVSVAEKQPLMRGTHHSEKRGSRGWGGKEESQRAAHRAQKSPQGDLPYLETT